MCHFNYVKNQRWADFYALAGNGCDDFEVIN